MHMSPRDINSMYPCAIAKGRMLSYYGASRLPGIGYGINHANLFTEGDICQRRILNNRKNS